MAPVENLIRAIARRWVSLASQGAIIVVLAAVCVTAGLGFYAATNAGINTDTSEMLDRRLPFRQLIEKSREAFPQFGKTILIVLDSDVSGATDAAASDLSTALREKGTSIQSVFYPADDPFFRKNGFLYLKTDELEDLADRLTAAQPFLGTLARDPSLRGFVEILAPALQQEAEQLNTNAEPGATSTAGSELRQILSQLTSTVIALADDKPGLFPWQEILTSDRNRTRAVILVQPQLNFSSLSPAKAAMAEIREIAEDLKLNQRGVTLRLTGAAALSQEELKSVESNIGLVGLLSLVFVGLLLFVGMRSPAIAIAVLFTLICGLVWTGAFAVAIFGSLNLISVAFAVLFIGLGVDFGIHFGLRAKQAIDDGSAIRAALSEAGHDVGFALALTTVMAAIGFLSFLPTDYRGLSQLGVISAGGMVIAFIGTLTVCPAILALLPPKQAASASQNIKTKPRL
ncbi:MAG: MMPL family transporter, partial [Pseudomonadota bacterium]